MGALVPYHRGLPRQFQTNHNSVQTDVFSFAPFKVKENFLIVTVRKMKQQNKLHITAHPHWVQSHTNVSNIYSATKLKENLYQGNIIYIVS